MNLWMYNGKKVKIIDLNGQTFVGIADYHSAENNTSGVDSLAIEISDSDEGILYEFEEHEIASIELFYTVSQNLAVAV